MNIRTAITMAAIWAVLAFAAGSTALGGQVRIKDITDVDGVRVNRLVGFGLITGLNGSGGNSPITRQFAINMLDKFGVTSDPIVRQTLRQNAQTPTNNISVVTVTAELPVFARPGGKLDVMVSTFDNATSLQGGALMTTSLYGIDNRVYALASGPVSIGGFSFAGQAASVQKNHPTTGRVPNGAIVEETVPTNFVHRGCIYLTLRDPDFETARRIVESIHTVAPYTANAIDPGTVRVLIPREYLSDPVSFMGVIGNQRIEPDSTARVVINERTGTIVIGQNVRLSKVAINHANLAVVTGESPEVSQPEAFSQGETVVVPRTTIDVTEERNPVQVFESTTTVGDLAQALNVLGVSPRDISSIFQQLKSAGALHAELELK